MRLYEINQAIRDILAANDEGEIDESAWEQLDALTDARTAKIEAIACIIKEHWAESSAIKAEEQNLAKRRKALEKTADNLENYLATQVDDKFETARCKITFRKSEKCVIDDEAPLKFYSKYWTQKEPTISIEAIKDDLKAGKTVPGAHIEERRNIQIK